MNYGQHRTVSVKQPTINSNNKGPMASKDSSIMNISLVSYDNCAVVGANKMPKHTPRRILIVPTNMNRPHFQNPESNKL